ncbi:MAG: adenylate/guanylate cyclase domain-containing protein [Candidatus Binatia bacterium]
MRKFGKDSIGNKEGAALLYADDRLSRLSPLFSELPCDLVETETSEPTWRGYDDPTLAARDLWQRRPVSQESNVFSAQAAASPPASLVIFFTDMVGSTRFIEEHGDEKAQELLRLHNRIIRGCLRLHRGREIKHTGDGVMASFSSASAAIGCAVAIQKAFALHNRQHPEAAMQVRIGTNAGEPIAEEGQLFGTAVNAAARLCDRARPGQILVSDVVRQLLAGKDIPFVSRGRFTLKGFAERMRVYEVPWRE